MFYANKYATMKKYLVSKTILGLRPAVLILPGGRYLYTSGREGKPVATAFNNAGFQAFVLRYSTMDKTMEFDIDSLIEEVKQSVEYIKENAQIFRVDVNKIYLIGFSAGGHLAANTINKYPDLFNKVILSYPALELTGPELSEPIVKLKKVSELLNTNPTNYVHSALPPIFIWHTINDETVPIKSTLRYLNCLEENKVKYEAHLFQHGAHGMSLANELTAEENNARIDSHAASWVELAISWLKR